MKILKAGTTNKSINIHSIYNHLSLYSLAITIYFYSLIFSVESYNGSSLRLIKLDRRQMGPYLCIASNDVPPAVSKRVMLSVHCKY